LGRLLFSEVDRHSIKETRTPDGGVQDEKMILSKFAGGLHLIGGKGEKCLQASTKPKGHRLLLRFKPRLDRGGEGVLTSESVLHSTNKKLPTPKATGEREEA